MHMYGEARCIINVTTEKMHYTHPSSAFESVYCAAISMFFLKSL